MTSEQEAEAKRIIARQLEMSDSTLHALYRAGLTQARETRLDFYFTAKSERSAEALAASLTDNDCLDLKVVKSGGFLSRRFIVSGKTYPTVVTAQVLAEWIPWIVVQGVLNDCEFDGWGAQV